MYMCMYECVHVCMYASSYLCIFVSMYVSMYLCVYAEPSRLQKSGSGRPDEVFFFVDVILAFPVSLAVARG